MHHLLSTNTFFIAGLAVEIQGAIYLARSAILPPIKILLLSSSYFGYSPGLVASYIENRITGQWGILGILMGYLLQTAGYLAQTVKPSVYDIGLSASLTAGCIALLLVVLVWGIKVVVYPRAAKKWAIKIARAYDSSDSVSKLMFLCMVGDALGWQYKTNPDWDGTRTSEYRDDYLRKTFNIAPEDLI